MARTPPSIGELAGRLAARFVFVVGKGGVGKTTTAGAVALACADAGHGTHLISTDPAHSVGDLFEAPLAAGRPAASECSPTLLLEEFDAAAFAHRWLERTRGALAELVERGTYLDEADGRALLELTLPGIDEVAAAWRLAELDDGGEAERIVVDTAPTGHMLRLLDAGAVVRGWVEALDAMADKAAAVAAGLTGRRIRLAAEAVVDEMRARTRRFDDDVLRDAAFVLVTRAEPAVRAETDRLEAELERRGLRVEARVRVGGGAGGDAVAARVPHRPGARGCAALRALAGGAAEIAARDARGLGAGRGGRAEPATGDAGSWLRAARFEWHLFAGKGGVGKSTCAAACALALAESRGVVLFGADPAGSLGDVLGTDVPDGGLRVGERLHVRQLDARTGLARFRSRYRDEIERVFERAGLDRAASLDRRVVESLLDVAPPGIDEAFAFAGMLELADDHDAVVVDAAPTGHFLRLLAMPELALDWAHALMRVLLGLRSVAGLDETGERLLDFARRVRALRATLTDAKRTAVFLVTHDDPMVAAETRRLRAALGWAGLPLAAVLRNRVADGDDAGPASPRGLAATRPDRAGPAADGPPPSPTGSAARPRRLSAPAMTEPIIGPAVLRAFFERWEIRA